MMMIMRSQSQKKGDKDNETVEEEDMVSDENEEVVTSVGRKRKATGTAQIQMEFRMVPQTQHRLSVELECVRKRRHGHNGIAEDGEGDGTGEC